MFDNLSKGEDEDLLNLLIEGGNNVSKLITVSRAKEEIKRLQNYIDLVENYEADTIDKLIIKEYALTNSINEVSINLNKDRNYIVSIIKSKGKDDLHKFIRSGYLNRTKHSRSTT